MSEPCLYIVATPIGNLSDITSRAIQTLSEVDFIAAEDTRVTLKLLNHFDIKKPLVSCYRHNEDDRSEMIVSRIIAGESCALCCDAGTPGISDPGEQLVATAIEHGVRVVPIPGASALVSALSCCGLPTGRFCFEGFLPTSRKNRAERLTQLVGEQRTVVLYEAPHKLRNTLRDLLDTLGERRIVLARELTKVHEEFERTTLIAANKAFEEREPRGEYVLVIEGSQPEPPAEPSAADAVAEVMRLVDEQGMSLAAACKQSAAQFGMKKYELYRLALDAQEGME